MATNQVPGFLPSTHGFAFSNSWPRTAARHWSLGLVEIGIGNAALGLCGGMVFAVRDRFERGDARPASLATASAPAPFTPLFEEIVDRQFASFGTLWSVPLRFWIASALLSPERLLRDSIRRALPAIRSEIDGGRLAMVGLVRRHGWNPLAVGMGHQVLAYRYATTSDRVTLGIYDPNHPGDDSVEIVLERSPDGRLSLAQSTGEPLLGLLALPWAPAKGPMSESPAS
ncbi:MAG TPA: hypothetical protein VFP56_07510 [Candidatus Limnocylindrales bacterium]|nr:hypothetical protein [Candidatus Limnocylindrales bacterium]